MGFHQLDNDSVAALGAAALTELSERLTAKTAPPQNSSNQMPEQIGVMTTWEPVPAEILEEELAKKKAQEAAKRREKFFDAAPQDDDYECIRRRRVVVDTNSIAWVHQEYGNSTPAEHPESDEIRKNS